MKQDVEYHAWQRQWQHEPEPSSAYVWSGLEQRIHRQTQWNRIGLIAPIVVTVGMGGYLLKRAAETRQLTDILLAAEGWIFIAVVWAVCLWIARGTWAPFAQTTAAFVDLAIRRCRSNLKATHAGAWLYAAQLICLLLLLPGRPAVLLTSWPVIVLGWIGFPAYLIWLAGFHRRQHAELRRLQDLSRQLTDLDR